MGRKIGEIFEYNGEWYQCVEGNDCANCVFIDYCKSHSKKERDSTIGLCVSFDRNDGMHVIFKKLEKVGEPYMLKDKKFQKYRVFHTPYIYNKIDYSWQSFADPYYISLEIEQNKEEGMKEKKVKLSQEEYDYIRKKIKVVILPSNLADDVDSDDLGSEIMKLFSIDEKLTKIETNGTCFNNYKKEDCHTREFYVEVKQNKEEEDMEEKKINFIEKLGALCKRYNMSDGVRTDFISEVKEIIKDKEECNFKPFNLEEAKLGKPVCTRDGRKARIICFDRKGYNMFPIVALIMNDGRESDLYTYRPNGIWDNSGNESDKDLMMLPEKKEGWINVYKSQIHNTLKSAEEGHKGITDYMKTVKVEWEE